MANRIMLNQTSYHGAGAIQEIVNEAKAHGFKKAFVCSDPDLVKFNVTSKVTDLLKENGLDYELYSDIKPNPTIENVQHGVQSPFFCYRFAHSVNCYFASYQFSPVCISTSSGTDSTAA